MLAILTAALLGSAVAQTSGPPFLASVGHIALIAHLPSSVRVSQSLIVLSADVSTDQCTPVTVPADLSWNVEWFVREVRLVGTFPDSASALSDGSGHLLPAANIELLVNDSRWVPLPEPTQRGSGITLATLAIVSRERQGHQQIPLHFRVCRPAGDFTAGTYSGTIELHATYR